MPKTAQDPAYVAYLAEKKALRERFALDFGAERRDWSDHAFARLLNSTGERPARVAELRALLGKLDSGGTSLHGGAFDHRDFWYRGGKPWAAVGHPYDVTEAHREAIARIARTFPTVRLSIDDRPSYYGFGTNHVRFEVPTLFPRWVKVPSTRKTRQVARDARKAFAEEMRDDQ